MNVGILVDDIPPDAADLFSAVVSVVRQELAA